MAWILNTYLLHIWWISYDAPDEPEEGLLDPAPGGRQQRAREKLVVGGFVEPGALDVEQFSPGTKRVRARA